MKVIKKKKIHKAALKIIQKIWSNMTQSYCTQCKTLIFAFSNALSH